jgi:tRNA threonylcarbamoyladenosine biosynthesis protein TsaE
MTTPVPSLHVILSSPDETESFGSVIGRLLGGGEVVALIGELGAGKTALVRGIVAGAGAPAASVASPTFLIVHKYEGQLPIIHVDLYRLQQPEEIASIGLVDYFTDDVAVAIEWADRFPQFLPKDRLEITLAHRTRTTRSVQVEARGSRSHSLLSQLENRWRPSPRSVKPPVSASRKPWPR